MTPGSASDCTCYASGVRLCLAIPQAAPPVLNFQFLAPYFILDDPETQHKIVRASGGKIENPSKSHIGYLGWDCRTQSQ